MLPELAALILIPLVQNIVLVHQVNVSGGAERFVVKLTETIDRYPGFKLVTNIHFVNETGPYWESSCSDELWIASDLKWLYPRNPPSHLIPHHGAATVLRDIYKALLENHVPSERTNKLLDQSAIHVRNYRGPYYIEIRKDHIKLVALRTSHGGDVPLILWFSADKDPSNHKPEPTPQTDP